MKGTTVCDTHGGRAPQTREAAWRRVLAAQDAAAAGMIDIAFDEKAPIAMRFAARKDLLDRGGTTVRQQLELVVKPWEEALQEVMRANGVEIEIESGDVLEGELVADDDGETPDSASTRDSELRRRSSVDSAGTDRPQGTIDPHQEANRAQLARQRRRRR